MDPTQNSFSELIQNYIVLQNNAFLILQKISESVTSDSESISFELSDVNGNTITYNLPSYGYMKNFMERIDNTLMTMLGLNDNGESLVRNPDGSYSRIYQAKVAKEPTPITTVDTPLYFRVKPNWFFENLLDPMLYINIDISKYVDQNATKIKSRRIILQPDTDDKITAFNENIKGRNDIVYDDLIEFLDQQGIAYINDEEVRDLPLSVLRYRGSFDVLDIKDVETTSSRGVTGTQRKYYLNKLTYSDNFTDVNDNLTLAIGNQFIVGETIYEITSVDTSVNAVTLKKINGYDTISIGAEILQLYSETFSTKQAEIAIGFNERQVVFFKSINDDNNLLSREWSNGIAFYTNELKIKTTSGEKTLYDYYQKNVVDFSNIIIGQAKENTIPSIYGVIPNTPTLDATNFEVTKVNSHLFDTKELNDIRKKGRDKVKLASEISQLEKSIDKQKQLIGNTNFKSDTERRAAKNELDSLIREKTSKSSLYASIIAELTAITKDDPSSLDKPKYRIRGFFDIPDPVSHPNTGKQEVIQFEISYRYLKENGTTEKALQLAFKGKNSQIKRGTFTPWKFVKSSVRKRYYDSDAGIYKWRTENIEDPEVENINQVDIPITKGEQVELRVRAISEAGWPFNPILSEWSESITIQFPIELLKNDEAQVVLSQAAAEEVRVKFEETLAAEGLDLHLASAIQTGDAYWPHHADTINSGFFDSAGLIISLYEKLKSQDLLIKQLQDQLNKVKPTLDVKLYDEDGNTVNIANGAKVDLFAGYYTDEIAKLSASERKGAIITKQYTVQIANLEGSTLELVSRFPGGLSELLPDTTGFTGAYAATPPDEYDYSVKRKYDKVPICNMSVGPDEAINGNKVRSAVLQSSQLLSQYLYSRYKDLGLVNDLYIDAPSNATRSLTPGVANSSANASFVWDISQTISPGDTPRGNGALTNFCIHTDCPILDISNNNEWNDGESLTLDKFLKPAVTFTSAGPTYPLRSSAFRHAYNFNAEATDVNGVKQLAFKNIPILPATGSGDLQLNEIYMYPDKLGFYSHDRYFIGSDTCGAYLFIGPSYFDQLLVDGTDYRAKREVEAKDSAVIKIPIYFQYRMVDYYGTSETSGIVGGYSGSTTGKTNLTYEKRIGLDLYIQNETVFSFDIDVTAKYTKNTVSEKLSIDPSSSARSSSMNVNRNALGSI